VEGRTMTRNRVVAAVALVGLVGVGLTLLAAAGQPTGKSTEPAKPTSTATDRHLICLGYVDTEERMVGIYPDNFPQPSQVIKVLVKEGDEVREGQKLLELDVEMYALKVSEAEAGVKEANAKLAQAQAMIRAHGDQIKVLEKELEAKEAELEAKKTELKQAEEAVKNFNKSPVELEGPKANVKAADLTLIAARLKLDTARAEVPTYLVDQANAGVIRAKELKRQAERALAQATCTAKADGKVIRTFVSEGSSFGPTTREPAFWFLKKGPLLIRAEVTQEFSGRVTKGQSATITDESDDKLVWKGRVTKVGDQFLHKRQSNGSALDIFPVNDDRVLECIVLIDPAPGQSPPRFGQRVRISLEP
jgi:multidrug efflux pump subunit AcrA (membrane-fusion protein)